MKVAVSYLASENKKEAIKKIDNSTAEFIHVDLCDGKYVKTKNFTIGEVVKLLKDAKKPLDIHLMCVNPLKYIDDLAMLNTDCITIHLDSCNNPKEVIDYIQSIGIKAGIAINPKDKIDVLNGYLNSIEKVLFMSVVPGKGGQDFIEKTTDKIDKLNLIKSNYTFEVSVDGGINNESISLLKEKGIDIVVCGSYITNFDNYDEGIEQLKNNI